MARLPVYLQILSEQFDGGVTSISSEELAEFAGLNAAKVRKDLSYLGSYGTRGVGYDVEYLVYQIRRELGLTHDWPVVIVGAGNLGQALAGYGGFSDRGFPVGGIVDVDDAKVGSVVGGVRVRHLDELAQVVQARNISIGVIATPGRAAQEAADALVAAGVTSLLNFAPRDQRPPRHQRPQGRPRRRAADPQLLRAAACNGRAGTGLRAVPGEPRAARPPRVGVAMSILVIGVNHRSGPLALLERVTIAPDHLAKAVAGLAQRDNVREAVVLSTCNRTEVYVVAELFHGAYGDVRDLLCELGDSDRRTHPHLYSQHDAAAVTHLFEVAAGLDSAVLGESEILGQVRPAWEVAQHEGAARSTLNQLFRAAVATGKRARTETGIARGTASISHAAVEMITDVVGDLGGRERSSSAPARWAKASPWRFAGPVAPRSWSPTAPPSVALRSPSGSTASPSASTVCRSGRRGRRHRRRHRCRRGRPHRRVVAALMPPAQRGGRCTSSTSPCPAMSNPSRRAPRRHAARPRRSARLGRSWAVASCGRSRACSRDRRRGSRALPRRGHGPPGGSAGGVDARGADRVRRGELERFAGRLGHLDAGQRDTSRRSRAIVAKLLHEPSVRLKSQAGTPQGERNAAAVATCSTSVEPP